MVEASCVFCTSPPLCSQQIHKTVLTQFQVSLFYGLKISFNDLNFSQGTKQLHVHVVCLVVSPPSKLNIAFRIVFILVLIICGEDNLLPKQQLRSRTSVD